jgi:hypothetical protein
MDPGKAVVLRPDLAVHMRALRAHHVHLGGVDVLLGRQREVLERLALAIELHHRGLIHIAQPQIAGLVGAQPEEAGRESGLVHRDRIFAGLAGLGIEPAQELLAEARIPGDAVAIDHHVMRLDGLTRQVVFGDDDAGVAALGTGQGSWSA